MTVLSWYPRAIDGLQAGHPLDEAAAGAFRRDGGVGTTYYFMDPLVNGEFGRELGTQQRALGIKVGDRLTVEFTGNWPSYVQFPPIAPPASPPDLHLRKP
ncbi:hypothetical protein [Streptomyces sp. NPDC056663]|uniref:hypothetical protein n=1 Tax=Streptomyces sp. NPDC056663 TaxID=3345899 RepID=UPI0036D0F394